MIFIVDLNYEPGPASSFQLLTRSLSANWSWQPDCEFAQPPPSWLMSRYRDRILTTTVVLVLVSPEYLKRSGNTDLMLGLNKIRQGFPRIRPALSNHVGRLSNKAFRSSSFRRGSSTALKGSASASFVVSLVGLLVWFDDTSSPSPRNEVSQFASHKLQESVTDLRGKPPPPPIERYFHVHTIV
ncbi:hypothetical protein BKA61DRAFT_13469 [Leptodontidium sp. MPI-SDFR-AT-0119]|nr:hypothetical protein BKA61DRAFT_13469 [Leptodontidium sp. MPI-SDFR-AT-0119]